MVGTGLDVKEDSLVENQRQRLESRKTKRRMAEKMKSLLVTMLCIIVGLVAGLYFSRHLTGLLPANTQALENNSSIIMRSG